MRARSIFIVVAMVLLGCGWLARSRWSHVEGRREGAVKTTAQLDSAGTPRPAKERAEPAESPRGAAPVATVFGVVVDGNDAVLEGAVVTLDTRPVREERTGFDGSFVFSEVDPGAHVVIARRGELASRPLPFQLRDSTETLKLRLAPSSKLHVRVKDARTGGPVPLAQVTVEGAARERKSTDADGAADFIGLPAGAWAIGVEAEGYAAIFRGVTLLDATATVLEESFALLPGLEVSGVVVAEGGRGVAGARVRAVRSASLDAESEAHAAVAVTDADGRFRVASLHPSVYRFEATGAGFAPAASDIVTVASGSKPPSVQIKVAPGGRITGRVTTSRGAKVAGARVRMRVKEGGFRLAEPREIRCDDDGRFELDDLPRSRVALSAASSSGSSATQEIDLAAAPLAAGIELALRDGGMLRGTVVDRAGTPLPHVEVMATALDAAADERDRGPLLAATDAMGRFEWSGLGGQQYAIRAAWPGSSPTRGLGAARPATQARVGTTVQLVLERDGAIRGRLVRRDGSPIDAFDVTLDGGEVYASMQRGGSFLVEGVAAGSHRVDFRGAGFVPMSLPTVSVVPEEVQDVGAVVVEDGRRVRGRVEGGRGEPVAFARVFYGDAFLGDGESLANAAARQLFGQREVESAADGSFEIDGVGEGAVRVMAEHPTLGRSTPQVAPPKTSDAPLVLVIRPGAAVFGKITSAAQPLPGVMIAVTSAEFGERGPALSFGATTGDDGGYRIEKIPPGRYAVVALVQKQGGEASSQFQNRTLSPGGNEQVNFDLPASRAKLTVHPADGDARPKRVSLQGAVTFMQQLLPGVPCVFNDVPPGAYVLCAQTNGETPAASKGKTPPLTTCQRLEVGASPAQEVTLDAR